MIHALLHHPESYSARSGLFPLVQALGARPVFYQLQWERMQRVSWSAGQWLRAWGIRHYGSAWNALVPVVDEWRLARRARARTGDVVHFLFGEFAAPRHPRWFRREGARLVGTFHCSARRQPAVLGNYRCLDSFDRISVMSQTQIPFFVGRGYPAERIQVTLHGVDTLFFQPPARRPAPGRALRGLLVGSTERDHDFAAALMKSLAGEPFELSVLTSANNRPCYDGLANVRHLEGLDDAGLRDAYGAADLLVMPLLDCTANNALLESIACGTPVLVNRVGGVPEYMGDDCAWIMDGCGLEAWRETLRRLAVERTALEARRAGARARAERFDWSRMAPAFRRLYEDGA